MRLERRSLAKPPPGEGAVEKMGNCFWPSITHLKGGGRGTGGRGMGEGAQGERGGEEARRRERRGQGKKGRGGEGGRGGEVSSVNLAPGSIVHCGCRQASTVVAVWHWGHFAGHFAFGAKAGAF